MLGQGGQNQKGLCMYQTLKKTIEFKFDGNLMNSIGAWDKGLL